MEIKYKNKSLEKECTISDVTIKAYGRQLAIKIHQRIKEFRSIEMEQDLVHVDRCHMLKGKRKTQYAVDLGHPFRLVFELVEKNPAMIRIVEIEDYHGKM